MATDSASFGDDPGRVLSGIRDLTRRVRQTQRATWFPLLVFAVVTFASVPVFRYGGHHPWTCVALPAKPGGTAGRICTIYANAQFVYWPIALVLAYVAIAAFYIRRTRALGIETRVRPYAIAGVIIAAAVTGVGWWEAEHPLRDLHSAALTGAPLRLATAGAAIGLALLVLAWAERNGALLVFTVVYLAAVLLNVGHVAVTVINSPWLFLPMVIQGCLLLLGSLGFALAQKPWRSAE
jgi:hypothetical protein